MKWSEMREIQKNALIAEKIFGWQWIPYTFYDAAPPDDQLWLLPDGQVVSDLTPGEWTYYEEDEQGHIIGNRYIPYWIPHYTTSMDAAWQVLTHLKERELFVNFAIHCDKKDRRLDFDRIVVNICFHNTINVDRYPYNHSTVRIEALDEMPEAICKAALIACGAIEDKSEL